MRRTFFLSLLALAALTAGAKQRFSYVYAVGDGNTTISSGWVNDIVRVNQRYSGEYVWARLDGREYLIRDAALLAEVRTASAARRELEPEERALRAKMKPLERKQNKLEREYDELADRDEDDEALTATERDRMRDLERQIREVERELRVYEREEEKLDRREDELDEIFDGQMKRIVERAIRAGTAERVQ